MGRRHLIRFAALVAVLVCVPAAAAGTHVSTWLLQGTTEPNGTQTLHAYFASRRSDLGPWVRRLTAAHQARIRRVDFDRTVLFAGFLDGQTCAFDVRLTSWTYVRRRLIVNVAFRKPPVGTATCVRTSVSYLVIGFNRAELGVLPTFVQMRTIARA